MARMVTCKHCKNKINKYSAFSKEHVTKSGTRITYYCSEEEYNISNGIMSIKKEIKTKIKSIIKNNGYECDKFINVKLSDIYKEGHCDNNILEAVNNVYSNIKIMSFVNNVDSMYAKCNHIFNGIYDYLNKDRNIYIYRIYCKENMKNYIGVSTRIEYRMFEHIKFGINGISDNCGDFPSHGGLYVDIYRYGIDKFLFEVIEQCRFEERYEREKYYIELFDSWISGYNMIPCDNIILGEDRIEFMKNNKEYCTIDKETLHYYRSKILINKNIVDKNINKKSTNDTDNYKKITKDIIKDKDINNNVYTIYMVLNKKSKENGVYIGKRKGRLMHKEIELDLVYNIDKGKSTIMYESIRKNGGMDNFLVEILDYVDNDKAELVYKDRIKNIKDRNFLMTEWQRLEYDKLNIIK